MSRLTLVITLLLSCVASTAVSANPIRIACVGDSITAGSGLKDPRNEAWPAVLGKSLGSNHVVENFGVSGATLLKKGDKPYWDQAAFAKADAFKPKIVIIALGTNDSKPANWDAHHAEFSADATALVAHFAALPGKPEIWLCLPPPIFSHAYGINEDNAAKIRALFRTVASTQHLHVIDLGPAMKTKPQLFRDGVHPLAEGAKVLGDTVATALKTK